MGLVEVTEKVALSELGPQLVKVTRRVCEAMHRVCSFYNDGFWKLVNKQRLTHGESLLDSVYILLSGPTYNIRIRPKDIIFYDIVTLEGLVDALDLFEWVMRLGLTAICFVLLYSSVSDKRCC